MQASSAAETDLACLAHPAGSKGWRHAFAHSTPVHIALPREHVVAAQQAAKECIYDAKLFSCRALEGLLTEDRITNDDLRIQQVSTPDAEPASLSKLRTEGALPCAGVWRHAA